MLDILSLPLFWAFMVPTFIIAVMVFFVRNGVDWAKIFCFWFIMLTPCLIVARFFQ